MTTDQHAPVPSDKPDGSTNVTDEQKERTESLSDGSDTDGTPVEGDSDTTSGGDPE